MSRIQFVYLIATILFSTDTCQTWDKALKRAREIAAEAANEDPAGFKL